MRSNQRWASHRFFDSSQVKSFIKNSKSSQVKSCPKIFQVKSKFKSSQVKPKLIDWEVRWSMKSENKIFNVSKIVCFISSWIHSAEIVVVFDFIFLLHLKLETKIEMHKKFTCYTLWLDLTCDFDQITSQVKSFLENFKSSQVKSYLIQNISKSSQVKSDLTWLDLIQVKNDLTCPSLRRRNYIYHTKK